MFKKIPNRKVDMVIKMVLPESYIGMVAEKTLTVCECVGINWVIPESDGLLNKYPLLIWNCTYKPTGQVIKKMSSFPLKLSKIPATKVAFKNG